MEFQMENAEVLDLIIIGAGLSGIGVAYYFQKSNSNRQYAILEARETLGGTWSFFKYPGIRSDSDLFSFGYEFKPWTSNRTLATAEAIVEYMEETVDEFNIRDKIQCNVKVLSAKWLSQKKFWELTVNDNGIEKKLYSKWLQSAAGYYNYDEGYTPKFNNVDVFKGDVIHPQHWPENYDYANKKIVVIGSGATAFTLVPNLAKEAKLVTMLQRTPSYVMSFPSIDNVAGYIRKVFPEKMAYKLIREKNTRLFWAFHQFCKKFPNKAKKIIRNELIKSLPSDFPIDKHFTPPYNPWDQRLCFVPDGDLFKVLSNGKANIETDGIDTFTAKGIKLKSGKVLEADTIITATGLNLKLLGGIPIYIDDKKVDMTNSIVYKGAMISNIPNFTVAVGYTNISWTLKITLLGPYVANMTKFLFDNKHNSIVPIPPNNIKTDSFFKMESGYIQRSINDLPRQGIEAPWSLPMNYFKDIKLFKGEVHKDKYLLIN